MNPSTLPPSRGSAQVLTPTAIGTAVRVGKTRKFRKMLLPAKRISASGRSLDLSSYFPSLVQAERDRAFDAIVLQVNDRHTKDPRFTEGTVSNLVRLVEGPDGDGLYGDIEFADEQGARLVAKNPRVGVSVSMVENLVREEDGQKHQWPAALQHVLMTTDPHVRSMGGWHPIELSSSVAMTIDLSGSTYDEIEEKPMTAPTETAPTETAPEGAQGEEELVTVQLSREDSERLSALLAAPAPQTVVVGRGSPDGAQGAPAGGSNPEGLPAGSSVELEREDDALELMREEIATERQGRLDLQRELNASRAANELDQLEHTGLAPSVIELARPLLEAERGSGVIELSRDSRGRTQSIDPTSVIRQVLHQVIELSRRGELVVDLDREIGMHVGGTAEQNERAAKLAAWNEQFPIDN